MLKLNNKGFAVSTLLYGLLVLIVIILYLIFHIVSAGSSNTKIISDGINRDLEVCRTQRINYLTCLDEDDCNTMYEKYKTCYCNKIYKDNTTCKDRMFNE